ncbi:MAG: TIM barrel protein [Caldilineaceae bacterium]
MSQTNSPRLSVSTWSLHRTLGKPANYGPGQSGPGAAGANGGLPLHELPARLADFGIHTLEICHFHLPSTDDDYLKKLRGALDDAGIELWSLLIDGGDLTDPLHADRDQAWIADWVRVAGKLGAKNTRVVAGKAEPTPATLEQSRARMSQLLSVGQAAGVRIMTENWLGLMSNAESVLWLLEKLDGQVGLCVDFGNWRGPQKYDELAAIMPHGDSSHAKAAFLDERTLDRDDYVRCLELAKAAHFSGPHTLIYDGPNVDEWFGLSVERDVVQPYLS